MRSRAAQCSRDRGWTAQMLVGTEAYGRLTGVCNYFLQSFSNTMWSGEEEQGVIDVAPYSSAYMIGNTGFSHPLKLHSAWQIATTFSTDVLSKCLFKSFVLWLKRKKNIFRKVQQVHIFLCIEKAIFWRTFQIVLVKYFSALLPIHSTWWPCKCVISNCFVSLDIFHSVY